MLAKHLKDFVIIPVLDYLGLNSESAVNLILGTACESDYGKYLRQINHSLDNNEGAFGIWQIELKTENAVTDYLDRPSYKQKRIKGMFKTVLDEKRTARKQELLMNVLGLQYSMFNPIILAKFRESNDDIVLATKANLIGNLYYQCAIARCKYLMIPEPLPAANDIEGLAKYWKKYYNSEQGKGTIEHFVDSYNKHVKCST